MKLKFYQRGGEKNHDVLERAARFFAGELMSTRLMNKLSINIKLRATKLSSDSLGNCRSLDGAGSRPAREFEILLQRDDSLRRQVKTLAHEMAHVEQLARNRLQNRRYKTDGLYHYRWEGEYVGVQGKDWNYETAPWEVEARKLEEELFHGFWYGDQFGKVVCVHDHSGK